MSDSVEQSQPTEHLYARHGDAEPSGLDPQGYTAHRLHHATPTHLHLTTRRIFVGPVPIGWLKSHRREWYKDRLDFYYSKRKDSFRAADNVYRSRELTGLDQMDEEDEWWSDEALAEVEARAEEEGRQEQEQERESQGSDPVAIPPRPLRSYTEPAISRRDKGKGRATSEEGDETPRPRSSPSTPRARLYNPKTRGDAPRARASISRVSSWTPKSTLRSRSGTLERGESFATAQESWGSSAEHLPSTNASEQSGKSYRERPKAMSVISGSLEHLATESPAVVSYAGSDAGESSSSPPPSLGAQNSLASLLKKDKGPSSDEAVLGTIRESSKRKRPSLLRAGSSFLSRKAKNEDGDSIESVQPTPLEPQRQSTNRDRVNSGLVRFNTNIGLHEHDVRMQQKLEDLSRKRSIRYAGRKYPHVRKREGEIIRMESMLVRIEVAPGPVPAEYDENESMKVATQIVEKWREYVVVCRESADDATPMTLRLYKSRNVPAIERPHVSSHSTREIPLDRRKTKVNLYSSLDKTLVVWLPSKHGHTLIYVMRPRCSSVAVEWYSFLRHCLSVPDPDMLQIAVPDLAVLVRIENPFSEPEGDLKVATDLVGAKKIPHRAIPKLLPTTMKLLDGVDEWDTILEHWKKHERMGLAWRRYDRLEWLHGVNERRMFGMLAMQRTHELELRPKTHYPTFTTLRAGTTMTEPPPIEGFLIRLTSTKGRQERMGRIFTKRMYFTTHDQLLCYCRPARASPPPPPKLGHDDEDTLSITMFAERMPIVYCVAPYAVDSHGEIEWLANGTPDQIGEKDLEAYTEAERKVNTLLKAEGFVDLCKVEEVRRVTPKTYEGDQRPPSARAQQQRETDAASDVKSFELVLNNGLILKLQAFDEETRDEWISRLSDLVTYWKARDREDLAVFRRMKAENLAQLHVDEEMESILGQFARKWEVSRSVASGDLFNVCGISSCRTITLSGVLYRKPRVRATFRRYNVILCHGELLIFHNSQRDRSGKEVATVDQERHLSMSLRDCYIYSGLITESELLYRNQTFDSNFPGHHALPKVYADGYTSQDEDTMTTFVLWHGQRRSVASTRDKGGNSGNSHTATRVSALGAAGKAVVFKARSRVERDTWVMSISMEIERLNSDVSNAIKVMPQKSGWFGM